MNRQNHWKDILKQVDISLMIEGVYGDIDSFMEIIGNYIDFLPEVHPDVWDSVEPMRRPFTFDNIKETLSSWPNAQYDFDWKKKKSPKAWGSFSRLFWTPNFVRPAELSLHVEVSRDLESRLLAFLKQSAVTFNGQYGYFDYLADHYRAMAVVNKSAPTGGFFIIPSHQLQKFLPDVRWFQIFGKPYVDLIGADNLLNCPAFKVEQLGPDIISVQLTQSIFDLQDNAELVEHVRNEVKNHLDKNIFFRIENSEGHVYRTPDFNFPPRPVRSITEGEKSSA